MWSSTQQNGQIAPGQSELLRSPFVQWQSDPTLSQTGDGQQRSKLLSSPGRYGERWLGVAEGRHSNASVQNTGKSKVQDAMGEKVGKLGKWTKAINHF